MNKLKQIINTVNQNSQNPFEEKKRTRVKIKTKEQIQKEEIKEKVCNQIKKLAKESNTTQLQAALKISEQLEGTIKNTTDNKTLNTLEIQLLTTKRKIKKLQTAKKSKAKKYAANPEKFKKLAAKWNKNNPEKVRENSKKRYDANPEKYKESVKKWRNKNPEKVKEYNTKGNANRREKMKLQKP